jgi:hypothetical protein
MRIIPPDFVSPRLLKVVLITIVLILGALPGLCAEKTYAIRLARHKPPIGQEYQFRGELRKSEGSAFGSEGSSRQTNTTSSIELLAHCKVLANAHDGDSVEVVIQHLIERQATNSRVLLAPGSVVIGKRVAGETFYKVARGQPSLAATKALGQLLGSVSDDMGCTQDQAFGTQEPKKIGDTWKGNAECLTKGLNRYFEILNPNQFDVTMKLLGVEEAAGTNCLRVSLSMVIHTDQPGTRIAKNPRRLLNAKWDTSMHFQSISLLPMNQDLPCSRLEEKGEGISKVNFTSREKAATLEIRFTQQKTVEVKLLN